jgi:hypothetical protein
MGADKDDGPLEPWIIDARHGDQQAARKMFRSKSHERTLKRVERPGKIGLAKWRWSAYHVWLINEGAKTSHDHQSRRPPANGNLHDACR